MSTLLTENKINILSLQPIGDGNYAILFEYCYYNKSKSKMWAKDVKVVNPGKLEIERFVPYIETAIMEQAKRNRAELEK